VALAVIYVVVDRWLRASPEQRRALAPLAVVGVPALVVAAVSIAHDYLDVGRSPTGDKVVHYLALVYTAIPAALLLGVLRTRLRRVLLADLLTELGRDTSFDDEALEAAAEAARSALREERPLPNLPELTRRELEVLALIAEGRTDRGIAKELYVTPKTVEAHVRSIFSQARVAHRRD
jgi:DNA-binding CsgD family transcriptional regulator